jgi:uncharacterized GH25 family protein
MSTYKVIRFYQRDGRKSRTIKTGLTLEAAQAHCHEPETSSNTATSSKAKRYTAIHGPWFDGYEEERPRKPLDLTRANQDYFTLEQRAKMEDLF